MKKKLCIALICLILAAAVITGAVLYRGGRLGRFTPRGQVYAEARTHAMADLANANEPEKVYDYLTAELRGMISREEFAANWAHERTYPYLIPYWVFYRGVELAPDGSTGTANFERAARLPGQYEHYGIVYENGGYYFDAFRAIADGSYIAIFDRLN